jgi:hypothetical protein
MIISGASPRLPRGGTHRWDAGAADRRADDHQMFTVVSMDAATPGRGTIRHPKPRK